MINCTRVCVENGNSNIVSTSTPLHYEAQFVYFYAIFCYVFDCMKLKNMEENLFVFDCVNMTFDSS